MSLSTSSILIFEMNKKFLLFKILTNELYDLLYAEVLKNYGDSCVEQKNEPKHKKSKTNGQTNGIEVDQEDEDDEETEVECNDNEVDDEVESINNKNNKTDDNGSMTAEDDEANSKENEKNSKLKNKKSLLTDDLIYQYFSPLINSFEFSKEINYVYEYALFNKNQHIIRFNLYKNCLILCIQNSNDNLLKTNSDLKKLIYSEYLSGWYCKSITSLLKYKFGICGDEKCFNSSNQMEIRTLYSTWCNYYLTDVVYFLEAIEQLDVSDDIKLKCQAFLDEFVEFLAKTEEIMSEFDFMDESYDELRSNYDEFPFPNDESSASDSFAFVSKVKQKYEELENFFTDLTQIDQFILTYGGKLLYKYKTNHNDLNEKNTVSSFSIDSSSLYMLLLEAANFLDIKTFNPFKEESDNFKSASTSPAERSVIDSDEPDKNEDSNGSINKIPELNYSTAKSHSSASKPYFESYTTSNMDLFQSVVSTPIFPNQESVTSKSLSNDIHRDLNNSKKSPFSAHSFSSSKLKSEKKFKSNLDTSSFLNEEDNISSNLSLDKVKSFSKYKKTNCFLLNANKSLGFYEVLYIRLSENLCLISLKSSKLSKYCELISDFEALIVNFIDLLNRKRLILTHAETESSTLSHSTSFSLNSTSSPTNTPSISTNTRHSMSTAGKMNNLNNGSQDDRIDKAFFSFFMNKVIIFYEKLNNLKNELNPSKNSSKRNSIDKNFFKETFNLRKKSASKSFLSSQNSFSSSSSSFKPSPMDPKEISRNNSIKLIHSLQVKLNQLTNSNQFKQFFSFINNGPSSTNLNDTSLEAKNSNNELLSNLRIIETQITTIKTSLNELFYELFIANSKTITDDLVMENDKISVDGKTSDRLSSIDELLINNNNTSMDSSNKSSVVFKSTYLFKNLKDLFKKTLYHYLAFIDIKFKRNISMSYYWHLKPGLIHFSFINRQDNTCIVPTVDASYKYNLNEYKINLAYRKYMPIILTFLYKNDCTQFQFNDDKLELVFSYFIWFEDKNFNNIPVNFNKINQLYHNYNDLLATNKTSPQLFEANLLYQRSQLVNLAKDRNQYHPPGITEKSYYDLIKSLCYPNASPDSLTCYELICIHSSKISEDVIKAHFKDLILNFSKMSKS